MERIVTELRRVGFIEDAFKQIENKYLPNQFFDAFQNHESFDEFYCLEESTQIGVQLTAQISHAFYSYLKYRANENFINNNSFLRVVTVRKKDEGKSYDLLLEDLETGQFYCIENKLSQNKNSWQGSTSSTSKVDLFLLINFKIDRNVKLGLDSNGSVFTGVFAAVVNMGDKKWSGEAKNNSHRTKFEFRIDEWNLDELIKNSIIIGNLIPKQSVAHLVLETFNHELVK